MHKRKVRQVIAVVVTMVLILLNLCGIDLVENKGIAAGISAGETPLIPSEGGGEEGSFAPRDIQYGTPVFCYLTRAVTPMYAPYGTGCASLGITLPVNHGVYVLGRDYDCFYVYWYDSNNKEVYAYIPNDSISLSAYAWTQYDVYRKGECSANTQVLSGPGTLNTYVHVDYIDQTTANITVLAKLLNGFNNKLYYFIQWETAAGLAKRGWVDSTLGTVTHFTHFSTSLIDGYDTYMMAFKCFASTLALTYDPSTQKAVLQEYTANNFNQMFYVQKAYTNNQYVGFYRIIPYANPTKALTVSGTGYSEGLGLVFEARGEISKTQEFKIGDLVFDVDDDDIYEDMFDDICYNCILTRSSGENRFVMPPTSTVQIGDQVIHSDSGTGAWQILRIDEPWDGGYIKETNVTQQQYNDPQYILPYKFPGNYKVYISPEVTNLLTRMQIKVCVNRWNNAYPDLSLSVVFLEQGQVAPNTDRLATVTLEDIDGDGWGITKFQRYLNGILQTDGENSVSFSYDSNINSTIIALDPYELQGKDNNKLQMKVLTHELGHALKMTHTHQGIIAKNGMRYWTHVTQNLTVMDQGEHDYVSPTIMDIYRMEHKWDFIESW